MSKFRHLFPSEYFDRRLLSGVLHLFASVVVSKLLFLIAMALAARALGPAQWGIFSYAFTILFLMHLLGDFGFHTLIMKGVAGGGFGRVDITNVILLRTYLGLLSIALGCGAIFILRRGQEELLLILTVLGLSMMPRAVYSTIRSLTQGLEQMRWTTVLDGAMYAVFLGGTLVALYTTSNPVFLAASWTVSVLISAGIGIYIYRANFNGLDSAGYWPSKIGLLKSSLSFLMINVVVVIFHRAGTIILETYRSYEEVGYFTSAYQLFDGGALLAGLMITALFPRIVKTRNVIKRDAYSLIFIVSGMSGILALFFWSFAAEITQLVFGNQYLVAGELVQILALGLPFMAATGVVAHIFFSLNKTWVSASLTGVSLLANVIANMIVIPAYGMHGAAWVASLSLALNACMHASYFIKQGLNK